ncbi:spermatogenesis-associated protein 31A1-like, partial [Octodon degus]|uniref:Spermatogenesis-associated protein 31A1-like n=1 Tax=Octodon degus TaxID=10160 RepID=A0A6P3FFQ9_OCTDE
MGSSPPIAAAKTPISYSLQMLLPDPRNSLQPSYEHDPASGGTSPLLTPLPPYKEDVGAAAMAPIEPDPSLLIQRLLPLASSASPGPTAASLDLGCSPTSLTASQSPEPLLPLKRLSPPPFTLPVSPPYRHDPNTSPKRWWDSKERLDQQLGPHHLAYMKMLGIPFGQTWIQFFWGLPSLHSESLVAAAWISQNPSLQTTPLLFNQITNVGPNELEDKMSPQPQSSLHHQMPSLVQSTTKSQTSSLQKAHSPAHLQAFTPCFPPCYLCHGRAYKAAWPAPQDIPQQLSPTEAPRTGRALRSQAQSELASQSMALGSEEDYSSLTPKLSEDHWPSASPLQAFSLSPENWYQVAHHIKKLVIQYQQNLTHRIQGPVEVTEPQSATAHSGEREDEPGPSECSSMSPGGCKKEVQEVKLQREDRNVEQILDTVRKDPSRSLERGSGKFLGATSAECERNLKRTMEDHKNHIEHILRAHLCVKSKQTQEGWIPLRVRRSWLSYNGALFTQVDTKNLKSLKRQDSSVTTCQKLPSLNPCTLKTLEVHITMISVRHKWRLPLKLLRTIHLFKEGKSPLSSSQYSFSSTAMGMSFVDSSVEHAKFLEPTPVAGQIEEVTLNGSVPTLGRLLVSSPMCKETVTALTGISPDDAQGSVNAPPAGLGNTQPSQQLIHSPSSMTCKSRSMLDTGRGSLEISAVPAMCGVQARAQLGPQLGIGKALENTMKIQLRNQAPISIPDMNILDSSVDSIQAPNTLSSMASKSHLHNTSLKDMINSQMLDSEKILDQQKLRIPNHQHPWKMEKIWVPKNKGEACRTHSPKILEGKEISTPSQDGIEDTIIWKATELLPQKKSVPVEGYFQRRMKSFLQWVSPKKHNTGPEEAQKKAKTASSSAQRQRLDKSIP